MDEADKLRMEECQTESKGAAVSLSHLANQSIQLVCYTWLL